MEKINNNYKNFFNKIENRKKIYIFLIIILTITSLYFFNKIFQLKQEVTKLKQEVTKWTPEQINTFFNILKNNSSNFGNIYGFNEGEQIDNDILMCLSHTFSEKYNFSTNIDFTTLQATILDQLTYNCILNFKDKYPTFVSEYITKYNIPLKSYSTRKLVHWSQENKDNLINEMK